MKTESLHPSLNNYLNNRTLVTGILMKLLVLLFSSLWLTACQQPTPITQGNPTIAPEEVLPDYLLDVYPEPDGYVLQEATTWDYVLATLQKANITSSEVITDWNSHVSFLIDGTAVPIDAQVREYELERVYIGGTLNLEPGRYTATLQIQPLPPGEVLEYSWEFDVLDEEPSLPGIPEGFQFVRPLPDSTISQQAYREEGLVPPRYIPGFAHIRNGVCMGVLPHKIVEPGEFLDDDVFNKYSFVMLDGTPPGRDAIIDGGTEPFRVNLYDADGKISASYIGPHNYKCWRIDLATGHHEVVAAIKKASGEIITYTWQFTITQTGQETSDKQ